MLIIFIFLLVFILKIHCAYSEQVVFGPNAYFQLHGFENAPSSSTFKLSQLMRMEDKKLDKRLEKKSKHSGKGNKSKTKNTKNMKNTKKRPEPIRRIQPIKNSIIISQEKPANSSASITASPSSSPVGSIPSSNPHTQSTFNSNGSTFSSNPINSSFNSTNRQRRLSESSSFSVPTFINVNRIGQNAKSEEPSSSNTLPLRSFIVPTTQSSNHESSTPISIQTDTKPFISPSNLPLVPQEQSTGPSESATTQNLQDDSQKRKALESDFKNKINPLVNRSFPSSNLNIPSIQTIKEGLSKEKESLEREILKKQLLQIKEENEGIKAIEMERAISNLQDSIKNLAIKKILDEDISPFPHISNDQIDNSAFSIARLRLDHHEKEANLLGNIQKYQREILDSHDEFSKINLIMDINGILEKLGNEKFRIAISKIGSREFPFPPSVNSIKISNSIISHTSEKLKLNNRLIKCKSFKFENETLKINLKPIKEKLEKAKPNIFSNLANNAMSFISKLKSNPKDSSLQKPKENQNDSSWRSILKKLKPHSSEPKPHSSENVSYYKDYKEAFKDLENASSISSTQTSLLDYDKIIKKIKDNPLVGKNKVIEQQLNILGNALSCLRKVNQTPKIQKSDLIKTSLLNTILEAKNNLRRIEIKIDDKIDEIVEKQIEKGKSNEIENVRKISETELEEIVENSKEIIHSNVSKLKDLEILNENLNQDKVEDSIKETVGTAAIPIIPKSDETAQAKINSAIEHLNERIVTNSEKYKNHIKELQNLLKDIEKSDNEIRSNFNKLEEFSNEYFKDDKYEIEKIKKFIEEKSMKRGEIDSFLEKFKTEIDDREKEFNEFNEITDKNYQALNHLSKEKIQSFDELINESFENKELSEKFRPFLRVILSKTETNLAFIGENEENIKKTQKLMINQFKNHPNQLDGANIRRILFNLRSIVRHRKKALEKERQEKERERQKKQKSKNKKKKDKKKQKKQKQEKEEQAPKKSFLQAIKNKIGI